MAKVRFNGKMDWPNVAPGRLSFSVTTTNQLREAVQKLRKAELKRGEPFGLELTMEVEYRSKTYKQLQTYYALCRVVSAEWNGGMVGPDMMTEEHADAAFKQQEWWPRVETPAGMVPQLKRSMKTMGLALVIDAIFSELCQMGLDISSPEDIGDYWRQWMLHLSENGVMLYADREFLPAEYKDLVGRCEACGCNLRDGGGSLAHVKSKGMGGDPSEGHKFLGSERMYLCDPHHALYDNGRGRTAFLQAFPHLRLKIESGTGKEYSPQPREDGRGGVEKAQRPSDVYESPKDLVERIFGAEINSEEDEEIY